MVRCLCGPTLEPLTRSVIFRVAHAPGIPGTFSPPRLQRKPLVSDPSMHHSTCVTHVPWCMSGSLTHGGWEKVPGACATLNFAYLLRGPLSKPIVIQFRRGINAYQDWNSTVNTMNVYSLISFPDELCAKSYSRNVIVWRSVLRESNYGGIMAPIYHMNIYMCILFLCTYSVPQKSMFIICP